MHAGDRHVLVRAARLVEAAQAVHADLFLLGVTGAAYRFAVLPATAVAGVVTDAAADDETLQRRSGSGVPIITA